MPVHVVDHPLVRHKLGLLREKSVTTKDFRELAAEITRLLTYEATRDLPLDVKTVQGWAEAIAIQHISGKKITVVPILRAGLGMLDGVLDLIPSARVSIVGIYRDESTLEPVEYYQKLAPEIQDRTALVVDPMLATGGSLVATIDILKENGCKTIKSLHLVAVPEGIHRVEEAHPDVEMYVAAIDRGLNPNGYILPGLGDAGDKLFGTR